MISNSISPIIIIDIDLIMDDKENIRLSSVMIDESSNEGEEVDLDLIE